MCADRSTRLAAGGLGIGDATRARRCDASGWRGRGGAARVYGVALMAVLAMGAPPRAQEIIDRMLAVVAGDLIMMSDVSAALEFGLVPLTGGPDTNRVILSQLIDRSLMLAEVERYAPPEPSDEQLARELERARGRFSSADAFEEALQRYGIEESHLRQTLRATLRLRAYLEQRFASLAPTDEDIAAYYARHADRFARAGRVVALDEVRDDVIQALAIDRRQTMVDEWIASLRRRAVVLDLSAGRGERPPTGR